MTPELDQIIAEAIAVTGVTRPAWLEDDAPLLVNTDGKTDVAFYLVGLIGGKDVGKSALVNALVGQEITARTSHGPGTETVIAYAHADRVAPLRELLEREAPGRYQIVEHRVAGLLRQVLLDLPDIDSHWAEHVTLTRKMLRHMLFPLWVQSIEKYADRQPQELLAKVAAGNAPGNFVFCLNKVDQVEPAAVPELQQDYAARLQRVLNLDHPPRVWAISAIHPNQFDLPALRTLLAQQKSEDAVRQSQSRAALRQKSSVLAWLQSLDLPARAERLGRLHEEAEEFINDRLGGPLLGAMLPRLTDDPLYRQAVIDDCMSKRVARWPIVGIFHAVYSTFGAFLRRNAEPAARPLLSRSGDALVDQHLATFAAPTTGRSLADSIQTTFALLQQSHPALSALYADRKLWEPMPATQAADRLREALIGTVDCQRLAACTRFATREGNALARAARFILTIGALLWFPLIHPLVKAILVSTHAASQPSDSPGLLITILDTFSMTYLLNTLTFFILYFSVLWLILRWDTQRRVSRQFAQWRSVDRSEPSLSLTGKTLEWMEDLLEPVRTARERATELAQRVEEIRSSVAAE